MSSDATPVSSPEGLRFDEPAPDAGAPACARCQAAIASEYYEVNGHVVCASCKSAMEQSPAGTGASRMLRAAAYGLGGAILGAAGYYAILAITGYEIGLVAIAVGWLVGRGVQKGSKGAGGWPYQTLAVGLTYLAIVSTYIPFIFKSFDGENAKATAAASAPAPATSSAASTDSVAVRPAAAVVPARPDSARAEVTAGTLVIGILAIVAIAAAAPFLAGFENVLGLVIIGFALYQAWKMNGRVPLAVSGPYAVGRAGPAGE
jgi:hypothetical protein